MPDASFDPRVEDPTYDPRDIVTRHAFKLDETLLGAELAPPMRRLAAILIDLLLATLLAKAGGVFVGIAVAFIFFRLATRRRIDQPLKRWARATLAFVGALVLFGTVVAIIESSDNGDAPGDSDFDSDDSPVVMSGLSGTQDSLTQAKLDSVTQVFQEKGIPTEALSHVPFLPPIVKDALAAAQNPDSLNDAERARAARLLHRYADALENRDEEAIDSLRATASTLVAGPEIEQLRTRLRRAGDRLDQLDERNKALTEQLNNPSIWRYIKATARDLGLSFGWVGVYFTIFLAWWKGRTPGKWMLGLRVVRLDGKPLGLWYSFERFGGYAAGLATGLLGFAQIIWDPNRQGVHDKIAHTVVLRTRGDSEGGGSEAG